MTDSTENIALFAVVVKVEDIEKMRIFYRDVLHFGPPVVDSNFWVEFKAGENTHLILDKAGDGELMPKDIGRISWLHCVDDLGEAVDALAKSGLSPIKEERERFGKRVLTFLDPEGNPFQMIEKLK